MNKVIKQTMLALTTGAFLTSCGETEESVPKTPNIVLIFIDDAAWGDFRPFSEPRYPTPDIDRLAKEGCSYYSFYVPQAIYSASRAALLTRCYPEHTGLVGAHPPGARGLDPRFMTMGESFQEINYRTGWFGKWHIGDHPDTRPHVRGFDETAGIMYSNDMWADAGDKMEIIPGGNAS